MARGSPNPGGGSAVAPKFSGWFRDDVNSRLEFYYRGTKVGHLDASGFSVTDDTTARITNGLVQPAGLATAVRVQEWHGKVAAIASDGSGALVSGEVFLAPAACKILSAWSVNGTASDVTKGTATTSASYRRFTLVCNTAAAGTGTHVMASCNPTASAAAWATRAWTAVASTIPAGGIVQISHLTVGANTDGGTDSAEKNVVIHYELS